MDKKYSKVYFTCSDRTIGFRYNYETCELEWVSLFDLVWDEAGKEYVEVARDDWKVVRSVGLARDSWEENPEYWVEVFQRDIDDSFSRELE